MMYLSICIPTNGISEWVFPVLDSIFNQNADSSLYEVIVTDNGDNEDFHVSMSNYALKHENLTYKKTNAFLFENQIEALRLAKGEFLKFVNHRAVLEEGALEWILDVVRENIDTKPVIYLSNGALGFHERHEYQDFDGFVRGLKHYASWTTGVGVWRSDFERIPGDLIYNKISPHSDVLFFERHRGKYIIDDRVWSHEIDSSHKNKGKYDLYKAFAVEEIAVTLGLFLDGDISIGTLKSVIEAYKDFTAFCYWSFNVKHEPCSYKIDGFNDAMGVFMTKREVIIRAWGRALTESLSRRIRALRRIAGKIARKLHIRIH
ncbi:MAG: hypothetical protein IJS42_04545 [Synergistaceae bacterium]|nr:hypothetical protein [Synergistaceae bacterium]